MIQVFLKVHKGDLIGSMYYFDNSHTLHASCTISPSLFLKFNLTNFLLIESSIASFCNIAANRFNLIQAISDVCRESEWEGAEDYCTALTKAINDGAHDKHLVCNLIFIAFVCFVLCFDLLLNLYKTNNFNAENLPDEGEEDTSLYCLPPEEQK